VQRRQGGEFAEHSYRQGRIVSDGLRTEDVEESEESVIDMSGGLLEQGERHFRGLWFHLLACQSGVEGISELSGGCAGRWFPLRQGREVMQQKSGQSQSSSLRPAQLSQGSHAWFLG
jgi:hypothetical protein